ncbi:hypothetical protein ABFT80_24175 [Mesorhizobium sp. SB112]|uniref:hypothetical protein n=1 Tax=Mesorhizobium sp. SB112 TaxID=3151853 RepID=UPI003267E8AF
MRFISILLLLAGAAAAIFYPWVVGNFSGEELGRWRLYDRASGFTPVQVSLQSDAAPVRVLIDMATTSAPRVKGATAALTLTADRGGRTVLATAMSFTDAMIRDDAPQTGRKIFRDDAGFIDDFDDGDYLFTAGPGDADGIVMDTVDLVLRGNALVLDTRYPPAGFLMMALGAVGFIFSLRRRRSRPENPNSQPPPPRWGRGDRP